MLHEIVHFAVLNLQAHVQSCTVTKYFAFFFYAQGQGGWIKVNKFGQYGIKFVHK